MTTDGNRSPLREVIRTMFGRIAQSRVFVTRLLERELAKVLGVPYDDAMRAA